MRTATLTIDMNTWTHGQSLGSLIEHGCHQNGTDSLGHWEVYRKGKQLRKGIMLNWSCLSLDNS